MPDTVISASNLTKRFGDLVAVDHVDFAIRRGESFGFLGPNGAGKTSTMRMIYARSPVTDGDLTVLGMDPREDPRKVKARIGVVPQQNNLDPDLTVLENMVVFARFYDIPGSEATPRAHDLLEFMELDGRAGDKVDTLSGGMKRRLLIARALMPDPELLLLDEPTTGLDPQARHLVWDRLEALKAEGVTLLLTTHYMEEAQRLCDRLVIMDEGEIIERGAPDELVDRHVGREVVEVWTDAPGQQAILDGLGDAANGYDRTDSRLILYVDDGEAMLRAVEDLDLDLDLEGAAFRNATLEDVFLKLAGRRLVE